jgi:hypothetical protein
MAMLNKVIERDGDNVLTSAMIDLKEFRVCRRSAPPFTKKSACSDTARALILVAEPHTG